MLTASNTSKTAKIIKGDTIPQCSNYRGDGGMSSPLRLHVPATGYTPAIPEGDSICPWHWCAILLLLRTSKSASLKMV